MTDNIPVTELTEGTLDGGGVFDSLMRSFKAHIDEEFKNRRITGPEYSQVYLGGVQSAMAQSVQFLLGAEQAYQQAELLKAQVATQEEQTSLVAAQTLNTAAERAGIESRTALTDAQVLNVPKEGLNIEARTEQAETQTANLLKEGESLDIRNQMSEKEALHLYGDENQVGLAELQRDKATKDLDLADSAIIKSGKENDLMDGQISKLAKDELQTVAQTAMVTAQTANVAKEGDRLDAQVEQTVQQTSNLVTEDLNTKARTSLVDAQVLNETKQGLSLVAKTAQTEAQTQNIVAEGLNIPKQGEMLDQQVTNLSKEAEALDTRNSMSLKEETHLYGDEFTTGLTEFQRNKLESDVEVTEAQALNLSAEKLRIMAQTSQIEAEVLNVPKQGQLLDQQVSNLTEEVKRTTAQTGQITAETLNVSKQGDLLDQQVLSMEEEVKKVAAQVLQIGKQNEMTDEQIASEVLRNKAGGLLELQIDAQQNENAKVQAETQNIASQRLAIEAGTAQTEQQTLNLAEELANLTQRNSMLAKEEEHLYGDGINTGYNDLVRDKLVADTSVTEQQATNLTAELAGITAKAELTEKQALQVVQETVNALAQKDLIDAQVSKSLADTSLVQQNTTNAVTEETVLKAQQCKLEAEFDLTLEQRLKTVAETSILNQKKVTEQAQTSASNVDDNSVIGRQKALYAAQMEGYKRDAEQKMAKILVDTWNVRRTTDEGTQANATNRLDDVTVGQAINTLLTGVGATS